MERETVIRQFSVQQLNVKVYPTREKMGMGAALDAAGKIKETLAAQESVNIIFAAAPSQSEFLTALVAQQGIDWSRINAFHMDEYIGLSRSNPNSFGNFLEKSIFGKVPFHKVYYLNGNASDPQAESDRYARLLQQYPADIVCLGIGENAHLAFNDPHVADFKDPVMVKVVALDEVSRQQQVHDNCFCSIEDVPALAITLTIPSLYNAKSVYCIVPGSHKASAVYHTLNDEVKENYPSTILRRHKHATLYLDPDSAEQL